MVSKWFSFPGFSKMHQIDLMLQFNDTSLVTLLLLLFTLFIYSFIYKIQQKSLKNKENKYRMKGVQEKEKNPYLFCNIILFLFYFYIGFYHVFIVLGYKLLPSPKMSLR